MPYVSKAQAAAMHAKAASGELSKRVVAEFDRAMKRSKKKLSSLPEHVRQKGKR